MTILRRLSYILFLVLLVSCNKYEGTGGTASIQGHVYKVIHDDDNFLLTADTLVAAKEDVFIVYGDDTYFGDDVETGENGTYRFDFLTPGSYTVYAYSTLPTGEKVAVKEHAVLRRGQALQLPDIYIHEGKAYGTSMLRGWVWATYFDKNGDVVRSNWAYDQRVYLQRLGEDYYFKDTRVGLNGLFYFQKLLPGSYVVYTFSQYPDETYYPVCDTVTITAVGQVCDADTLRIRLKN